MNKSDIDTLLSSWHDTKQEIAKLELRLDKYKRAAEKIMKKRSSSRYNDDSDEETGNNRITGTDYTLIKRIITRKTIGKDDVPTSVWDQYAKSCSYPAYYLNINK